MNSKYCKSLFMLSIIMAFSFLWTICLADQKRLCNPDGISIEQGILDKKKVVIRYAGQAITTEYSILLGKTWVSDKNGNKFLFLHLTNGGSCGDNGLLVTVLNGQLIFYDFEEKPCGGWRVIGSNKIVFWQIWRNVCWLGSCNACGPSYPTLWAIEGCNNDIIIIKRMRDLKEVYSDRGGRMLINDLLKDLRRKISSGSSKKSLSSLTNPIEREFCMEVVKGRDTGKILQMLYNADFSIGDRYFYFKKAQDKQQKKNEERK